MRIVESCTLPLYSGSVSRWEVRLDLSGKRYGFYFSWNTRQEMWMMTLMDPNGNQLLSGIRLAPGVMLLEKYRASVPDLPPGELWLVDIEGKNNAEVTRDNLHTRFALAYTIFEE